MAEGRLSSIALPAVVDLDAVDTVRDQLIEALEAGPVAVSGAGVERVATNALVMLLSAAETARRNGFEFRVADASEPMQSAIARLGFEDAFAAMSRG